MSVRSRSTRFVLWAAMCALLLKAAVPMLASAAAAAQGKSVAQVCAVYGVALPDPHAHHHAHDHAQHPGHGQHDGHDPGSHTLAHHGDHCALSALAGLATPGSSQLVLPLPPAQASPDTPPNVTALAPDPHARWAARLKHAPPALA
jgi:hypothetical protein